MAGLMEVLYTLQEKCNHPEVECVSDGNLVCMCCGKIITQHANNSEKKVYRSKYKGKFNDGMVGKADYNKGSL